MLEIWIDDELNYPVIVHGEKRLKLERCDAEEIMKLIEVYLDK